jgi:redox-sensitive bicupin YhaK (pirin superfamily)
MTAGTGVTHSEFNPSRTELVHLLQIWILPERKGLPPSYEQRAFSEAERQGRLRLVASRDGREGSVGIHQDVSLLTALLEPGDEVAHALRPGRYAWVQVARGGVLLNGSPLTEGDGAAASEEDRLRMRAESPSEVLVFELA